MVGMRPARTTTPVLLAGAGAIHLGLTPSHAAVGPVVGIVFAIVGCAQLAVAAVGVLAPSRRALVLALAAGAAPLAAYLVSRTVGLPLLGREAVGAVDLITGAFEVAVVVGAGIGLRRSTSVSLPARPGWAAASGVALLTVAALVSPSARHAHGDHQSAGGHEHAHARHVADGDHPTEGSDHHDESDDESDHAHTASEACTAEPTAVEQRAADDLVDRTNATLARFADVATAEAAGYRRTDSPGPQDSHWINPTHATDGAVLDPDRPESLIYLTARDGKRYLIGAMFLNDDAATEPPRPGGCLTLWHSHPGVCLGPGRIDEPGADGCPAGTREADTTDMLHVWSIDLPGGPFADIDSLEPADLAAAVREEYGR